MPSSPAVPRSGRLILLVSLALVLLVGLWCAVDWYVSYPEQVSKHFVGRDSCVVCHQEAVSQWQGSHHDRAMEVATEETVLGDFEDASFERFGVTTRFFRRDGKFFVNTEGPDGQMQDYQIKYTFGIEPLQQYMVEMPDGRIQVLRVSWDTDEGKWFYVAPPDVKDQKLQPGDPLHWTGIGQNWNTMCADCHSTNLQKNFDLASNTYHTTFSEIDVSCETCHGPASLHVALAEGNSLFWDRHHGYGLNRLKQADAERQLETCAPCHSRRSAIHPDFRAGDNYLDHYAPSLIEQGLYHADGQILDEVYVYGSYLQSRMYANNVLCTDCHNPHSLELKYEGNRLCAQCHQPGKYDGFSHHHHQSGEATQCVTCHMPSQTYMENDDRRDHSFRIPRPELTAELGTPNACNNCHTEPEETPQWAAEKIRQWYGETRNTDPQFAPAFAAAWQSDPEGVKLLEEVLSTPNTPAIVRATAVDLLGNYGTKESDDLAHDALNDEHALVRAAAVRALSGNSLLQLGRDIARRLNDPIRLVRHAAARRLVGSGEELLDANMRASLEQAVDDFREAQEMTLDRAGAHVNLAMLSQVLGDEQATIESLRTAIRVEPYLSGLRSQLATVLESTGGSPEEIRRLREKEVELLERDAQLLPESSQPDYQRGMLLYLLGRHDQARQALQSACEKEPNLFGNWMALALICEKQRRWQQAAEALQKMQELRPNDPATIGIFQRIQQAVQAESAEAAEDTQ